jgi:hypothetical protein
LAFSVQAKPIPEQGAEEKVIVKQYQMIKSPKNPNPYLNF